VIKFATKPRITPSPRCSGHLANSKDSEKTFTNQGTLLTTSH